MPRYEFFCRNCKKLFSMSCRSSTARRGCPLHALRQPGHRAVLVGLQRHHVEEERLTMASAAIAPILGN